MKKANLSLLALAATWLLSQPSVAQDKPKSAGITISVIQRSENEPKERPFANVGLFKLVLGDNPFDKAQCPSRSNTKGLAACRLLCDPDDPTELTLILRPPGSDAVPGYEVPVSRELTLAGCKLSDSHVTFAYTPLLLALRETLDADPELRQAVAITTPTPTFASLKPFEQSQPQLAALIARRPGDPNVERFARILDDASVAGGAGINASTATKVQKFSVGIQSVYVNAAVKRSLGPAKAGQLAPVTTDPARLRAATRDFKAALDQKPDKTPSDVLLHHELSKVPSGDANAVAKQPPKINWATVNRAGTMNPGK